MKKIGTLFCILLCRLAFAQVDLETERFTLERTTDQLYLTDLELGNRIDLLDMDSWSDPMYALEITLPIFNNPSLGWSEKVTFFDVDGQTLLYLEAYDNGDRFSYLLSYSDQTVDTWLLQGRDFVASNGTCTEAYSKYYLLADVNADGKPDIGVVEEEVYCKDDQVYFQTRPITWHVWRQLWWDNEIYTGELKTKDYIELGPSTAIEEVGMEYWLTYNPLSWQTENPTAAIFIPSTRIQRAIDEAKMAKDRETIKELRKYQNPLHALRQTSVQTKKYAWNDLKGVAQKVLSEKYPENLMQYFDLIESHYSYQLYRYLDRYADTYSESYFETDSTQADSTQEILLSANFRFKFNHPDLPWAKKTVDVTLDSSLNLANLPDYNIVPGFLTGGPDFISEEKAISIGKEVLLPTKEEWLTAELDYDYDLKAYYWKVYRKFNSRNNCVYLAGYVDLHAESGKELYSNNDVWSMEDDDCE